MARFRRQRPPSDNPPEWAAYLSPAEWDRLVATLERELELRKLPHHRADDSMQLLATEGASLDLSIATLARKLHAAPASEWSELTARELDLAIASMDRRGEPGEEVPLAAVRMLVRPDDYVEATADVLTSDWWPGIRTILAIKSGEATRLMGPDDLQRLGLDRSAVEDLARRNVWDQEQPDVDVAHTTDGSIIVLSGSLFTATFALWPERFCDLDPDRGALIAVPNRHTVLLHAIASETLPGVLGRMASHSVAVWREEPGPISASLFWTDGMETVEIRIEAPGGDSEALSIALPPFVAAKLEVAN